MIGKVMTGKSFRGCLLYCLNDKEQEANEEQKMRNRAEVLLFHKCGGNEKELIQQFNEVRRLNPNLAKPVLHITLSLAEEDKWDRQKLMEMSEACAKEMGFGNNQWVAILHHDTKHRHLHIVANRIGFDGHTVSDSNSYRRIADYCRKIEQQYGLKQVLSPKKFLGQKERQLPRDDKRKLKLQNDVRQCLFLAKNYEHFEQLMKEKKVTIERGRGITFLDEKKMRVKGSELGYSLQTVEHILAKKQGLTINQTHQVDGVKPGNVEQGKQHGISKNETVVVQDRSKAATAILNRLMKAEAAPPNPIATELLRERKKKKKRLHQ